MLEYIVIFFVLVAFILASYEDIIKREVYDYLNYSLAFIMLIIALFHSLHINSIIPIQYSSFGLLIGFAIGSALYYSGIWGGGDAKFLIGFGASIYYILEFAKTTTLISNFYTTISSFLSIFIDMFLNYLYQIILVIDFIFLLLIIFKILFMKNNSSRLSLFMLFTVLFSLFLGLDLNYFGIPLFVLGLIAFVLMFFSNENIFLQVYFPFKKKIENLQEGDYLDESLKIDEKISIKGDFSPLTKEDMHNISKIKDKNRKVKVKKIMRYGILIGLNYMLYILRIVTIDQTNLKILSFMFEFLFYSLIAGGTFAILIILYGYIKKRKSLKVQVSRREKMIFSFIFLISVVLGLGLNYYYFLLMIIIPIYLFIIVAKKLENMLFVQDKKIEDIVFGDWIVQDIKVENKKIYEIADFRLGVTEEQLARIKELSKKHENLLKLKVKDGLAFLPPMLIGFLILLLV
jgi:Flp pilus assembly protein protease CpaA